MGELIGLDAFFECCNNIKLLINYKVNNLILKAIKIITNRSLYILSFQRYEGKVTEIIRLDKEWNSSFRIQQATSDLNVYLLIIRMGYERLM